MDGGVVIAAAPWVAFIIVFLALCLWLRRADRARARDASDPAPPARHHAARREEHETSGREDD